MEAKGRKLLDNAKLGKSFTISAHFSRVTNGIVTTITKCNKIT